MREAFLLAVTVVTAVLAADPRCLQRTDYARQNLVHNDDCRKFLTCNGSGELEEHVCTDGLEFNPLLLKCDYPRGFCTPVTFRPVESVMSCTGLSDGAYYPELSDDCQSFYTCADGIPKVSKCSPGTKFDLTSRKCIDETQVQCDRHLVKREIECKNSDSELYYITHRQDGCKSYTECRKGLPAHKFCEGSQIFNEQIHACDWPQNVNCGSTGVKQRGGSLEYTDFDNELCRGKSNGYILGPNRNTNCASFYVCKYGQLVEKQCGDRLIFNWKLGVCDLPENVEDCDISSDRVNMIDCTNKHSLRLEHPDDCSAYIACHVGQSVLHKCGRGQRFNNTLHSCVDDPEEFCWKSTTTTDEILNLLAERPAKKEKRRSNSYPNYANGCRSYFDCKKTRCQERFCPNDHAYNSEKLRCEPEYMVFCDTMDNTEGADNVYSGNETTIVSRRGRAIPSYIDCCVRHGTWYEDQDDCTKFYVCVLGEALQQQCHPGQTFDKVRKICRPGAPCGTTPTTATSITTPSSTTTTSTTTTVTPIPTVITPTPVPCTEGERIPNSLDKSKYYQCIGGVYREQFCPSGQIFNAAIGDCEPIETSKCTNGDKVPNFYNTATYYQCHNNYWVLLSCPPGTKFDFINLECMSDTTTTATTTTSTSTVPTTTTSTTTTSTTTSTPTVPTPTTTTTTTSTPTVPTTTTTTTTTPKPTCLENEIYPDEFNKTKYYVCHDGFLRPAQCPSGMEFDPIKKYCEPANSACGDVPHGGFQPAADPTTYFVCFNGKLVLQLCQTGLIFNPNLGYCTTPGSVIPTVLPPPPPPPPPPNTNCGPLTQGQFVPDFSDNTKYYVCVLGKLYSQTCPGGQVFNNQTLMCVQAPTTSPPGGCGPYLSGQMISTCDPDKENHYLICVMGVFLIQKCPEGYNFSFVNQNCSIPIGGGGSPNCGGQPDGTSIAKPGSDSEYYLCIGGSPVLEPCPNAFIFNPISTVCENPCGVYDPVPNTGTYYVGSPSSESGYYACTGGKIGSLQQCPASTQFYPALGSLAPSASCLNPNNVNKLCPANSYASLQLNVNPSCASNLTPYYVLCNNGLANIQRCPLGSVVNENGYCTATSINCEAPPPSVTAASCICG